MKHEFPIPGVKYERGALFASVPAEYFDWEASYYLPNGVGLCPPSNEWKDPRNFEHLAGWISEDA